MSSYNWEERDKIKKEWLLTLKVGDEVAITYRGWGKYPPTIHRVHGFTPTCIRLSNNKLYYKDGGRCRGDNTGAMMPVDDEVRHEIKMHGINKYFKYEFEKTAYPNLTDTQKMELVNTVKGMLKENLEKAEVGRNAKAKEDTTGNI